MEFNSGIWLKMHRNIFENYSTKGFYGFEVDTLFAKKRFGGSTYG